MHREAVYPWKATQRKCSSQLSSHGIHTGNGGSGLSKVEFFPPCGTQQCPVNTYKGYNCKEINNPSPPSPATECFFIHHWQVTFSKALVPLFPQPTQKNFMVGHYLQKFKLQSQIFKSIHSIFPNLSSPLWQPLICRQTEFISAPCRHSEFPLHTSFYVLYLEFPFPCLLL